MPTMTEIYQTNSYEYDELVSHEDYKGNIRDKLNSLFPFDGKTVIEFGVGTGRVTDLYAEKIKEAYCYDRSQHMINKAQENLKQFQNKLHFSVCDNNYISKINEKADFVIEGWSFGHTVIDSGEKGIAKTDELITECSSLLNKNGKIIIFETLGTNTEQAAAPTKDLKLFYSHLEKFHGFIPAVIETDYKFESVDEAARILGFFFGEEMKKSIRDKNKNIVKEYTGLWYR